MRIRFLISMMVGQMFLLSCGASAQLSSAATNSARDAKLEFVVILTRHGVRSPTNPADRYAQYAAMPWPEWSVQPGYLTAHGYDLIKIFGGYYRARFSADGLVTMSGCEDAAKVTILADSDQRTRETGRALAEGMFPGCAPAVSAKPEGTNDPLFHPRLALSAGEMDQAAAAIAGRIGGDANNSTLAYRSQFTALDHVLSGCGHAANGNAKRIALATMPASVSAGGGERRPELRGPIATASSLTENLLLEYAEGMQGDQLGWGCLDETTLDDVMALHVAAEDLNERTPALSRRYAANMLDTIAKAMKQNASGKAIAGAPGKPNDRVLFLVGHDTNIALVAGAMGLDWIVDGRRNDTPPGGALAFELWREGTSGRKFVRVSYLAQTLDQMRETKPLTVKDGPEVAPVFVPGCSGAEGSCGLEDFERLLKE